VSHRRRFADLTGKDVTTRVFVKIGKRVSLSKIAMQERTMIPRNWSLATAWCLILGLAGCHLRQQPAEVPITLPAAKTAPGPSLLSGLTRQPAHDDTSSYGTMELQPDYPLQTVEARPMTPAEALKRSALMQEPTPGPGEVVPAAAFAVQTHISHEIHPVAAQNTEVVSGVETPLNSARIEQVSQPATISLAPKFQAAPLIVQPTQIPAAVPQAPVNLAPGNAVSNEVATAPLIISPAAPAPIATLQPAAVPSPAPANRNSRTLLNSNQMELNYRVGKVGPSGLGKVEVWATNDEGNTWQRLCEDLDRRSPSEIQLPGEGQWGLRLVAANGNGFGGTVPKRGDQATFHVEVDTTGPRVQLGGVEPADGQTLDIRWTAQDANLGSTPVTISYRTQPNLPWQVAAANVQNTGHYRWQFPREHAQFYVRVQVSDEAGNSAATESPTAVAVDVTVPQLVVVGVSGVGKR